MERRARRGEPTRRNRDLLGVQEGGGEEVELGAVETDEAGGNEAGVAAVPEHDLFVRAVRVVRPRPRLRLRPQPCFVVGLRVTRGGVRAFGHWRFDRRLTVV